MINRFPDIPLRRPTVQATAPAPVPVPAVRTTPPASGQRLPILYALQFCAEDKPQAMALARLIADLEPGPQDKMGFMFCPRFDTLVDPETEVRVRQKFPDTRIYQCRSRITGWPAACNTMVHEIYSLFHQQCHSQRDDRWQYAAIFFGEPDCVPLARDWISQIHNEWHECDWNWPLGNNQLALGHWMTGDDSDCGVPHINGNMLLSPEFLNADPAFRVTSLGAWDVTHSKAILAHGRPSKKIFSSYALGRDPKNPWRGCGDLFKERQMHGANPIAGEVLKPIYLHGCKDMRALECVREKLLP
jgi:hypothetical protein